MTWMIVAALGIGTYLLRLAGLTVLAGKDLPEPVDAALQLLPVALLAALVTVQTFGREGDLVVDARFPALLVAAVLLRFRVPLLVAVAAAMAVASGMRRLGLAP